LHDKHETAAAELGQLIEAVANYGEQARLLALNLAVAAAKIKPTRGNRRKLDDDLFGLVTRMTNLARQLKEITAVAEQGFDRHRIKQGDRLLRLLLEKGVFNEDVIKHLERSLQEVLSFAQSIAGQIGAPLPESSRTNTSIQ
jgi:hypothetical protein